jgi:magnesium-dependent phosphatase 1
MKLIVFDLDFTLWNAGGTWCDHTFPPYRKENGYILDSQGNRISLYPDTKAILNHLTSVGFEIAIASRTHEASWAEELLRLFSIDSHFIYKQIFPGSKVEHFHNLRNESKLTFEQMVFFDDEMRNISEVSALGVKSVLVDNGINKELVFSSIL